MSKYVDLPIGSQFGLLTVLERAPDKILPNGRHRGQFRCRCQCGNETVVDPTSLKNGSTKSCGCLHPGGKVGLKDLTGQTFGKLAVIERADDYVTPKGVHRVAWKCKCSCGREKVVTAISLSSGKTKSCGFCKHDDKYKGHVVVTDNGMKFIDLTGMTFGRLTVIGRGPDHEQPSGDKIPMWYAKCSCGNPETILVDGHSLKQGHIKSCGCIVREGVYRDLTGMVFGHLTVLGLEKTTESPSGTRVRWWKCRDEEGREMVIPGYRLTSGKEGQPLEPRRTNKYEFHDDYIIGYDNNGNAFFIDAEDYDRIKDRYWRVDSRHGYVENFTNRVRLSLHRFLMGAGDGDVVDHLNHDQKDNRKVNLRIVTPLENAINRKRRADNKSGCTGVYQKKDSKAWYADIKVNKENIRLGSFATFEEAVAARKAAEEKYFGAYSYDNSIEAVPRVERDGEPVAALPEDAPISAEPFAGAESLATPLDAKVSEIDPAPMPTQASPISAQEALGHQPSALTKEESLMAQVQSHRIHSTGRSARPSSTTI